MLCGVLLGPLGPVISHHSTAAQLKGKTTPPTDAAQHHGGDTSTANKERVVKPLDKPRASGSAWKAVYLSIYLSIYLCFSFLMCFNVRWPSCEST